MEIFYSRSILEIGTWYRYVNSLCYVNYYEAVKKKTENLILALNVFLKFKMKY